MLYDAIFQFIDSVPTLTFLFGFSIFYMILFGFLYLILLESKIFASSTSVRQTYILCKIMNGLVRLFLVYVAIMALWRKDIHMFNTGSHQQTPQIMINLSTMYTWRVFIELFLYRKNAKSTIIHHVCVIVAYIYVISVLTEDYNVEGIFKNFIGYAGFTTFLIALDPYCAFRFFIDKNGRFNYMFKRFALINQLMYFICNYSWQIFYIIKLLFHKSAKSSSPLILLAYGIFYFLLMAGWIQEEFVIIKYFWNL